MYESCLILFVCETWKWKQIIWTVKIFMALGPKHTTLPWCVGKVLEGRSHSIHPQLVLHFHTIVWFHSRLWHLHLLFPSFSHIQRFEENNPEILHAWDNEKDDVHLGKQLSTAVKSVPVCTSKNQLTLLLFAKSPSPETSLHVKTFSER